MNIDKLLEERGATHGDFRANAAVAQAIRWAIRDCDVWADLPAVYREALDHIAGKIGRILSAPDPSCMEPDHWVDIAGYARLAENFARAQQGRAGVQLYGEQSEAPPEQIDALLAEHARPVEPVEFDASC